MSPVRSNFLAQSGAFLLLAIIAAAVFFGAFLFAQSQFGLERSGAQVEGESGVTIDSSGISISGIIINNASSIILIPNATTTVNVNFSVSGGEGCGNIFYGGGSVTTTLYRSGASTTCATATPGFNYL